LFKTAGILWPSQNLEKNAVDGLLQMHSKKSHARVALKLTMYVVQDANSTELSLFHAGGVESIRNK